MIPFDSKETQVEDISPEEAKGMIEQYLDTGLLTNLSQVQGRHQVAQLLQYVLVSFDLNNWLHQTQRIEAKVDQPKWKKAKKNKNIAPVTIQNDETEISEEANAVSNEVVENTEEIVL